jgi:hypothetical protein
MNRIANIEAVCKMDGEVYPCHGYIEILGSDEHTVKIHWRVFMKYGGSVALKGISLYEGDRNLTNEQIIEKAVASIEKYRINRKRVFSEVNVI